MLSPFHNYLYIDNFILLIKNFSLMEFLSYFVRSYLPGKESQLLPPPKPKYIIALKSGTNGTTLQLY